MRARQTTFMCIVSGFIGAFIAMACGATDGGKDVYANDGDDITPIDEVILTKRIVECSWDDYLSGSCSIYDHIDGDEVYTSIWMKNGQPDTECFPENCDSIRHVIIE